MYCSIIFKCNSFLLYNNRILLTIDYVPLIDLQVTVDVQFKCMLGNKSKVLRVEVQPEVHEPTFKKDGDNIIYAIPPSIGIIDGGANTRLQIRTVR